MCYSQEQFFALQKHARVRGNDEVSTMKIGFISVPLTGHLNPMTALARKLQSRGHEVVFISFSDAEPIARAAKLDFVPFGEKEYPAGSIAKGMRVWLSCTAKM
jgi:UDP:flavonoid glycosyltransferase YjiC (YdhE family)